MFIRDRFLSLRSTLMEELGSAPYQGGLYTALRVVGKETGDDVDEVIQRLGLHESESLSVTENTLQKVGIYVYIQPVQSIPILRQGDDLSAVAAKLMAAAFLLLGLASLDTAQNSVDEHDEARSKEVPKLRISRLLLSVVMPARIAGQYRDLKELTLEEVVSLVQGADYVHCAGGEQLIEIFRAISIEGDIDYSSEQQVVLLIQLNIQDQVDEPPTFQRKLGLTHYLRELAAGGTRLSIARLQRNTGLRSHGFLQV